MYVCMNIYLTFKMYFLFKIDLRIKLLSICFDMFTENKFKFIKCMIDKIECKIRKDEHQSCLDNMYVCIYIYIYIYGGGLVFCLRFLAFCRQKQHIVAILRQTREKGRNKKEDQNWSCFYWSKSALFPQF